MSRKILREVKVGDVKILKTKECARRSSEIHIFHVEQPNIDGIYQNQCIQLNHKRKFQSETRMYFI